MDNAHFCSKLAQCLCHVVPTLDESESAVTDLVDKVLSANYISADSETLVAFFRKADYTCCLSTTLETCANSVARLEASYDVKLQSIFIYMTVADPKITLDNLEEAVRSFVWSLSNDVNIGWAVQDESVSGMAYKPYEARIRFAVILFFNKATHPNEDR